MIDEPDGQRLNEALDALVERDRVHPPPPETDLKRLAWAVRFRIADAGNDLTLRAIHSALAVWHDGGGSPRRDLMIARRTFVAFALADGLTEVQIAERVGCHLRTIERDVATLKRVFEPLRAASCRVRVDSQS